MPRSTADVHGPGRRGKADHVHKLRSERNRAKQDDTFCWACGGDLRPGPDGTDPSHDFCWDDDL